jgi:hypothetical protein
MTRAYARRLAWTLLLVPCLAQEKGSDATQSFVSPLGPGTGATVVITQKSTDITAAVQRQMNSRGVNFWQFGISGALDKNGQQSVYSSYEPDAPGFKAKLGVGRSSFYKLRPDLDQTSTAFLGQAWCRDILNTVNQLLPHPALVANGATCKEALQAVMTAFALSPPVDTAGKPDAKAIAEDTLAFNQLGAAADVLDEKTRKNICGIFHKAGSDLFKTCPDSGQKTKELTEQQEAYPDLAKRVVVLGEPPNFQWKLWGSWAPTLTSAPYRAVTDGVADLATKQTWTKLLNTGVGDFAAYYGAWAFGLEAGYGQTVQITTQNICKNTTSDSYTAQKCDLAMLGQPKPTNAWMFSGTLQVSPLPGLGKGTSISPGAEIVFSYSAPTSGGHTSELGVPFYFGSSTAPMSFVFGIQPTWDWNTDPKIGNKFSVSLFAGARPGVTK